MFEEEESSNNANLLDSNIDKNSLSNIKSLERRGAVSAEPYKEEDATSYVKTIIPKDSNTMKSLTKSIETNFLFSHLDENEKTDIFDSMQQFNYKSEEIIVQQGEEGDYFYIIDQGEVEVYLNNKLIKTIYHGGTFGELALIYGTPRAATIKAKSDCQLWAIDRKVYFIQSCFFYLFSFSFIIDLSKNFNGFNN
jgi:cAMP-dependent protein kinase regulator